MQKEEERQKFVGCAGKGLTMEEGEEGLHRKTLLIGREKKECNPDGQL